MADDKELHDLSQELVSMDLSAQLGRDMDKWAATLATVNGDKKDSIKRMMLLIGSGNLEIFGNKLDGKDVRQASHENNNLPISFYLSGHGGRVYMSFADTDSEQVLDWVTSGDRASDQGIHKDSYLLPGNRGGKLKGREVVYDRHAATHSATVDNNGAITELKGAWYGAAGMLNRMLHSISPINYFGSHSEHLGMNVAFGGNRYKKIDADIRDDGSSGHLYINIGKGFMGIGMEGTAPGTEGPLGAHSHSGGADRFTPGEGQKSFVKFDAKDANFITYLTELVEQRSEQWKSIQEKDYVVDKNSKNFFVRMFAKIAAVILGETVELTKVTDVKDMAKLTKAEQGKIIEELGLHVLKDEKGKQEMISTTLGAALMNAGMTVPYNYNGQKIRFSDKALAEVLDYHEQLPDEIIYFKPQDNLANFMAQAKVFANIDRKKLIKENPQLSLKECFALSIAYDDDQSYAPATLEDAKEKLEEIMKLIGNQDVGQYNKILEDFTYGK